MFKFSDNSLKKLESVDLELQLLCLEVLSISKVDFGISFGFRSAELQNKMFRNGASQCDGYKKISMHQKHLAIDFICFVDGKLTWEKKFYYYIVGLFESIAIMQDKFTAEALQDVAAFNITKAGENSELFTGAVLAEMKQMNTFFGIFKNIYQTKISSICKKINNIPDVE
jgi:hypothetical protein